MIKSNDMIQKLVELKVQPYETMNIDFEYQVPVDAVKKLYALGISADYLLFVSVCNLKCYFEQDVAINSVNETDIDILTELYTTIGEFNLKNGFLIIGETLAGFKLALKRQGEQSNVYLMDSYNDKILVADSFKEFVFNLTFYKHDEIDQVQVSETPAPNTRSKEMDESLKEFKKGKANKRKKREAIKEEIIAGFYKREQLFNAFMAQSRSALEQALKSQQQQAGPVEEREEYALYSALLTELPVEQIKHIANPTRFSVKSSPDNERVYCYEWDDLRIELKQMAADKISAHVAGFKGYVLSRLQANHIPPDKALEQRIMATSLVLGVSIMPGRDRAGRAEEVLGAIAYNAKSLLFFEDCVYDENAELII